MAKTASASLTAPGGVLGAARATILGEADALRALADALHGVLGESFSDAVDVIRAAKGRAIITGMGKSGHIARKIAATLASTGRPSYFVHPAEASHGDLGMITADDCVLALSRNGESPELRDILVHCRRLKIPLIAMTFKPKSTLAEAANVVLALPDLGEVDEQVAAPTISTTMCLALGDALAIALLQSAGFTADHFKAIHPGGKLGAMLKHVRDVMRTGSDLPVIDAGASATDMVAAMSVGKRAAGAVGITDGGKLVGVFTDGDLRRRMAAGAVTGTARDLMHANPRSIAPEASLADAMALLNQHQINAVFVVEHGAPVGLIHIQDLLAEGVR